MVEQKSTPKNHLENRTTSRTCNFRRQRSYPNPRTVPERALRDVLIALIRLEIRRELTKWQLSEWGTLKMDKNQSKTSVHTEIQPSGFRAKVK